MASTRSGTRGAKHEVQLSTHSTFSAPFSASSAAIASVSVTSSSPSRRSGTATASSAAVSTALRQLFWSMRDHST